MQALTGADYGAAFDFILLTDDPGLAAAADAAGVGRVGIDIERLGKRERQGAHPRLRISAHELAALPAVRARLARARAFVRCNPLHAGSGAEIDAALVAGAQALMLPWFHTAAEAGAFVELVAGRAEVSLLLESPAALAEVDDVAALPGVDEIVVGLNDLALATGGTSPFELVASPLLAEVARAVRARGVRFGFGGIADPCHTALPVPPSDAIAQYPRLGAGSAFVARSFGPGGLRADGLAAGLARCRAELARWSLAAPAELEAARARLGMAAAAWRQRASGTQGEGLLDQPGQQRVEGEAGAHLLAQGS